MAVLGVWCASSWKYGTAKHHKKVYLLAQLVGFFILAWRSLGEEGDTWRLSIESWNTGMSDSEMRICRESRLTGSPHPNPLGIESNPIRFLPTGEGAPSKLRGLGEFLLGGQGGIISPCGFGQSPRFSHALAWFGG